MHQIRIQSDGTSRDTVIQLADGTELEKVRTVDIHMDAGDPLIECDIELWMPKVDVHAYPSLITFRCPVCDKTVEHNCNGSDTLGGR